MNALKSLSRRRFLRAAGAGLTAAALAPAAAAISPPRRIRPNIIFILADDLGYGDLGCYGQRRIRTPRLDRMAAEGIRFTDAYAGSTVCAPSRCCLMTGLHTGHARVRGNARVPLRPGDGTVAEAMKAAGYRTGLIGKWGLGEPGTTGVPNRKGFDTFFGYLNQRHAHNGWPSHLWRNEEKAPLRNVVKGETREGAGLATEKVEFANDLFTEAALEFVAADRGRPFFLYLAYTIPHANNEAPRLGGPGIEVPSLEPYADRDWPEAQRRYAAAVTRLDRDVGRLLDRLAALGLHDRTVVFFSSDNGPHREGGFDPDFFDSGGPLRGIKRDLYEGGIRVPAIVRAPGLVEAGRTSAAPWAFWDFLPTAVELAGGRPPAQGVDGVSIVPELVGKGPITHPPLYWEFHERGFSQAVRDGRWKAVRAKGGPVELYDLEADVGEAHDLAAERPDEARRLAGLMDTLRTDAPDWPVGPAAKAG